MSTDLSIRNDWRFAGAILMEWASIAATLIVASRAHHVGVWLVAIFILGTRQQAIGILGHECVHRSAFASPRLNDIVGQVCCFWPVWSDLYAYRTFHFAHHRFLNTPQDPELEYRQMGAPGWDVPAPPNRIAMRFLFDLIGLGFMEAGRMFWIAKPRTRPARSSIALAWLTAAAVLWAAGALWVLVPWVVALFTSLVAVFRLRCWIEHLGSDGTHRVHLAPWLRWLVAPHGTWMHWEHHKMPGVPYYNLHRVREGDRSVPVMTFRELIRFYSRCEPVPSGVATAERGVTTDRAGRSAMDTPDRSSPRAFE